MEPLGYKAFLVAVNREACVVGWEHPANNDFLLLSQFSVTGVLYTCRPDLVGFINPDGSGLVVNMRPVPVELRLCRNRSTRDRIKMEEMTPQPNRGPNRARPAIGPERA